MKSTFLILTLFILVIPFSHGSEILKSDLAKTPISAEKAVSLTGWTGCIDRAWQISHIVCIEDGDTTNCISIENNKRKSMANIEPSHEYQQIVNDSVDHGVLTEKQKAMTVSPPRNDDEVIEESLGPKPNRDDWAGSDRYWKKRAEIEFEMGYYNSAFGCIRMVRKISQSDIDLVAKSIEKMTEIAGADEYFSHLRQRADQLKKEFEYQKSD